MNKEIISEISYIKGVGPKRAEAFKKLGIEKIEDLFRAYPRDYINNIKIKDISKFSERPVIINAEVMNKFIPRKPSHPLKLQLSDRTGIVLTAIWGNVMYREKQFNKGDKFIFYGKAAYNDYEKEFTLEYRDHKKIEAGDDELLKYPLLPLYILHGELKKTWIKPLTLTKIIFNALKKKSSKVGEVLSDKIKKEHGLRNHQEAFLRLHYPLSIQDIEVSRQTLAFEELFYLQLIIAIRRKYSKTENGISFENKGERLNKLFRELLSFELTNAQKRVIKEIYGDMKQPKPMNRLLQGDVGSGKTIVAVFCMLIAIENGYQCAFMCPTEILSEQHYKVLKNYFDKLNVNIILLTGGQKKAEREEVLSKIKNGEAQVVVGTHALFQEQVEFQKLGFIVIDEQHKFGVMQRAKLKSKASKGENPDILVMTATPIPRTLSLTFYGDLDVSVIDELPKGRKSIKTVLRFEQDRQKVYDFIRGEVKKGRQVYTVYPIIDESEKLDLKSAITHYDILKNSVFKDLRVALIHGRMKWKDIDSTIEAFKNKEINILVSTTIIEVGIDIPNATIMLIEEAQRFGLSQLHQLRGRVGRGAEQSYCILMAASVEETSRKRLETMTDTTDGFKIAEVDLQIRGPGEFFGTRQSGELKFTAADLSRDIHMIEKAREAAFKVIETDPQLREKENDPIRSHFLVHYKDSMELVGIA